MNTYNVYDDEFKESSIYKNFISENPSRGCLRIRAYAAYGAIPISGLKVVISTEFENNKIIFFEGVTDESGIIERISLPAPVLSLDNLSAPSKRVYSIDANYMDINKKYNINVYEGICVTQSISIVPNLNVGGFNGS